MRLVFATVILLAGSGFPMADESGDRNRGLAYAKNNCADCHAIDRDELGSPNVSAPAFEEIAKTPGISQLALAVFFRTAHEDMPNFVISEADARNLIAYILSLKN
jgi:mono/diheme cytochrome c family protein